MERRMRGLDVDVDVVACLELEKKVEATPMKRFPPPWSASSFRTPRIRVQTVGSARGEEEMEYWRRRSWGSMWRKSAKLISAEGYSSRRSRTLIRLEVISALKASSEVASSSFLAVSSCVTAMIFLRF